ncbi:MAG: S8 family serine peptidase, partial [Candidimonas sp.]
MRYILFLRSDVNIDEFIDYCTISGISCEEILKRRNAIVVDVEQTSEILLDSRIKEIVIDTLNDLASCRSYDVSYMEKSFVDSVGNSETYDDTLIVDGQLYQYGNYGLSRSMNPSGGLSLTDSDGIMNFSTNRDGKDVDVYVLDSGIRGDHKEFLDSSGNSRVFQVPPPPSMAYFNQLVGGYVVDNDASGHGTSVASLIGGNRFGFATKCNLWSLSLTPPVPNFGGVASFYLSRFILAVDSIIDHRQGRTNPAIINLSLQSQSTLSSKIISEMIGDLVKAKILPVVAAGNFLDNAANHSFANSRLYHSSEFVINGNSSSGYDVYVGPHRLTNSTVSWAGSINGTALNVAMSINLKRFNGGKQFFARTDPVQQNKIIIEATFVDIDDVVDFKIKTNGIGTLLTNLPDDPIDLVRLKIPGIFFPGDTLELSINAEIIANIIAPTNIANDVYELLIGPINSTGRYVSNIVDDELHIRSFRDDIEWFHELTLQADIGTYDIEWSHSKMTPLVVGAIDKNDKIQYCHGQIIDVFASGIDVRVATSSTPSSITKKSGTSFSTPMISGLSALYLSDYDNTVDVDEFYHWIKRYMMKSSLYLRDNLDSVRRFMGSSSEWNRSVLRTTDNVFFNYFLPSTLTMDVDGDLGQYDEDSVIFIPFNVITQYENRDIYWCSNNIPSWLSITNDGIIFGNAPSLPTYSSPTTFTFDITVDDLIETKTIQTSLTIMPLAKRSYWDVPKYPTSTNMDITIGDNVFVVDGNVYSDYDISVIDPNGDRIVELDVQTNMPSWISLTPLIQDIAWIPPIDTPNAKKYSATFIIDTPPIEEEIYNVIVELRELNAIGQFIPNVTDASERNFVIRSLSAMEPAVTWNSVLNDIGYFFEKEPLSVEIMANNADSYIIVPVDPIYVTTETEGLPDGVFLSPNGIIYGTPHGVNGDTDFVFAIKAMNATSESIAIFYLHISDYQGNIPRWITPQGCVAVLFGNQTAVVGMEAVDDDGLPVPVTFVSGSLPSSMTFDNGIIEGFVDPVDQITYYEFILSISTGSNPATIEREFCIIVSPEVLSGNIEWMTDGGSLGIIGEERPSRLSIEAIQLGNENGKIGYIVADENWEYRGYLLASQSYDRPMSPLPISPDVNDFYKIAWPGDFGGLTGYVNYGDFLRWDGSSWVVENSSPTRWIPNGMDTIVCDNRLDFIGNPNLISSDTTYNFSVKSHDNDFDESITLSAKRTFSITVENLYDGDYVDISIPLDGNFRLEWNKIANIDVIGSDILYRRCDPNYGIVRNPSIYLIGGLNLFDPERTYLPNLSRMTLIVDELTLMPIVVNNETLFEVIMLNLNDPNEYYDQITSAPTYPPSLNNYRQTLIDTVGFVRTDEPFEILPRWMNTYIAAIPIAYIVAGEGNR